LPCWRRRDTPRNRLLSRRPLRKSSPAESAAHRFTQIVPLRASMPADRIRPAGTPADPAVRPRLARRINQKIALDTRTGERRRLRTRPEPTLQQTGQKAGTSRTCKCSGRKDSRAALSLRRVVRFCPDASSSRAESGASPSRACARLPVPRPSAEVVLRGTPARQPPRRMFQALQTLVRCPADNRANAGRWAGPRRGRRRAGHWVNECVEALKVLPSGVSPRDAARPVDLDNLGEAVAILNPFSDLDANRAAIRAALRLLIRTLIRRVDPRPDGWSSGCFCG
jgi:hypothetical protein